MAVSIVLVAIRTTQSLGEYLILPLHSHFYLYFSSHLSLSHLCPLGLLALCNHLPVLSSHSPQLTFVIFPLSLLLRLTCSRQLLALGGYTKAVHEK